MVPKFSSTIQLNQTGTQRTKWSNTATVQGSLSQIFLKEDIHSVFLYHRTCKNPPSHRPVVSGCQEDIRQGPATEHSKEAPLYAYEALLASCRQEQGAG